MRRWRPHPALIALAAVVFVATVAAIVVRPDPDDIESIFAGEGALGPVLFAAAYAALTIVLFPGAPLTIAAGALYGIAGGALVSVIGASVGAFVAYLLSRRGTRNAVTDLSGTRFAAIEERLRGRGLMALLILRLIPIVPFNALNYAAGASGIGRRDYILATTLGIVPGALLYAAIGAGLDDPASPLFAISAALAIGLALLARRLSRRDPGDTQEVD